MRSCSGRTSFADERQSSVATSRIRIVACSSSAWRPSSTRSSTTFVNAFATTSSAGDRTVGSGSGCRVNNGVRRRAPAPAGRAVRCSFMRVPRDPGPLRHVLEPKDRPGAAVLMYLAEKSPAGRDGGSAVRGKAENGYGTSQVGDDASFAGPQGRPYTEVSERPATTLGGPEPRGVAQFGRAPVSKTGGWGFKSLRPCKGAPMNRQMKRMQERQERAQKRAGASRPARAVRCDPEDRRPRAAQADRCAPVPEGGPPGAQAGRLADPPGARSRTRSWCS